VKLNDRKELNQLLKWHNENFDKLCGLKKEKGKVKMFNLIPETARFKKIKSSLKKAVIHLNLLVLIIFFACGSDNPVNNTGNNPPASNDSLVYSLDSFSVWGSGIVTNDTTLFNLFNTGDSVKMTFTCETNCSNSDTAFANLGCGNIDVGLFNPVSSYTYYGSYVNFGTHILLGLKTSSVKYLRVKNFKLYKVNPV